MADADEIRVPVRVDTDDFDRKMRQVRRERDEHVNAGRDERRAFSPAFVGGAVGGFVGGAVGGALGSAFAPLENMLGQLLMAAFAPLIIALLPLITVIADLLSSPGFQKLIETIAGTVGAAADAAGAAANFVTDPAPIIDKGLKDFALDMSDATSAGRGTVPDDPTLAERGVGMLQGTGNILGGLLLGVIGNARGGSEALSRGAGQFQGALAPAASTPDDGRPSGYEGPMPSGGGAWIQFTPGQSPVILMDPDNPLSSGTMRRSLMGGG